MAEAANMLEPREGAWNDICALSLQTYVAVSMPTVSA